MDKQTRDFNTIPSYNSESFSDDIDWLMMRLRHCDIDEAVMVDLSKAEFDISVVRVIIPGLEGISDLPGYKPGIRANKIVGKSARLLKLVASHDR